MKWRTSKEDLRFFMEAVEKLEGRSFVAVIPGSSGLHGREFLELDTCFLLDFISDLCDARKIGTPVTREQG